MDSSLYRRINDLTARTSWAHGVGRACAQYGIVVLAFVLLAAWWQARRADDAPVAVSMVVWAAAAPIIALAVAQLVNHAVDRARPYAALPGAVVLIDRTTDASFPSDHATAAGAVAVGLLVAATALGTRRFGAVAAIVAVLLALSRLYVGAHYPSDVAAGLALGGAVAALAPLAMRLMVPVARKATDTPLRWLVADQ